MKKLISWKLVCGVMVGFSLPLSAVQAENANDRVQNFLGGDSPSISQPSNMAGQTEAWSSTGPQGPIRTDMTEDKSTASSGFEYKDVPYPNDDQNFPYAEGG